MGGFSDSLGDDFLGLRELGIAAELGLSSLTIPKKLLKGKSRGAAAAVQYVFCSLFLSQLSNLVSLQSTTQGTAASIPTAASVTSYHQQECGRSDWITASLLSRAARSSCTSWFSPSAPCSPSRPSIWLAPSCWRSATATASCIKFVRRTHTRHHTTRRFAHACASEARSPGSSTQAGCCCKRS